MMKHPPLTLYEEVLLLALDDDKGTTALGSMFTNAMAGAILAELVMGKSIAIGTDKHKQVTVLRADALGDPILDECLDLIRNEAKEKKATHWVTKFAGLKDLKNRVARQLVKKRVLKESEDKVLGIFKRTIYPESDPGPEREVVERMRKAIFTSSQHVDGRTVIIVALTQATQMLPRIFDKKKLKDRKQRLEKLTSGQIVGQATRDVVEAMQAAVLVSAVVVPVVITSST